MRIAGTGRTLLALVALGTALPAAGARAQNLATDVAAYAKACFKKIGLAEKDLAGPFQCKPAKPDPNLWKQLPAVVNDEIQDLKCDPKAFPGFKCASTPAATFPNKCDYPAWLELSPQNCYGNSSIQRLPTPSNDKVTAVLLCRHKKQWVDDDKYPDIAMIVHNSSNGETCWFQTDDSGSNLEDGAKVPGPATVSNADFWMTPEDTAKIGCVGCHDNGAFMSSRWMDSFGPGLSDDSDTPYFSSTPPFDNWPQPRWVQTNNDTCTSCHKIAAGGYSSGYTYSPLIFQSCADCDAMCAANPSGNLCRGCRGWIKRVTGQTRAGTHPKGANAAALADKLAIWMPPTGDHTRVDWDKTYKADVDALMKCCAAVGSTSYVKRAPGKHPVAGAPGCFEYVPKVGPTGGINAPPEPGHEVLVDRCKRRVAIVPSFDAKPGVAGTLILERPASGFSDWTPPFEVKLGPNGHIRWYCGQPNPGKWWTERSRCKDRSTKFRARVGPNRRLEMECLGS
jgi:hypothetical protein